MILFKLYLLLNMDALIFENERESLNWLISRRAKYSTLCLCHALHESDSNKVDYTCNKCSGQAKWHCGTCDDFDLCDACYKLVQHEHKMEPIKSIIGDSGAESSADAAAFHAASEAVQKDVREKHPSTLTADAALLLAELSDAELAPLEAAAEDVGVDPAPYYTTRTLGEAFLAKCDFERLRSFEPLFEGEQVLFGGVYAHGDDDPVEQGQCPPDEVDVTDGDGVERTREYGNFHSCWLRRMRSWGFSHVSRNEKRAQKINPRPINFRNCKTR